MKGGVGWRAQIEEALDKGDVYRNGNDPPRCALKSAVGNGAMLGSGVSWCVR